MVEGIAQPVGIDAGVEAALIAGLSNGTAYSFTLKAVDNSGNKSEGVIAGPCTPSDIVTVSTMEQLKAAIDAGGTKIIRLQAGTYTYTVASQGPEPISLYGNTDITLLPPESGTATIRAPGYSYSIFQVGGNATLTVGKAKATGNIVVNGSGRTIDSEGNAAYLVNVNTNGKFVMNDGVSLINNIMQAVVIAYDNASFEMNGGNISGNGASNRMGGGVYLSAGTFAMNGGEISGNIAAYGGGVYAKGIFIMNDGEIRANHSQNDGGGLYIDGGGAFTMNGGTIYGSNIDMFGNQNTCVRNGASIYLAKGGTAKWGTGINIFGMSPPVGRNDRVNGSK